MLFKEYRELQFKVVELLEAVGTQSRATRTFADNYGTLEIPQDFSDYDNIESYDHGSTLVTSFGFKDGKIVWVMFGDAKNPSKMGEYCFDDPAKSDPNRNPLYLKSLAKDDTGEISTNKVELNTEQSDVPIAQWFARVPTHA